MSSPCPSSWLVWLVDRNGILLVRTHGGVDGRCRLWRSERLCVRCPGFLYIISDDGLHCSQFVLAGIRTVGIRSLLESSFRYVRYQKDMGLHRFTANHTRLAFGTRRTRRDTGTGARRICRLEFLYG